ncbi:MAG: chemotaxis-specific protein-glutamate methyltransferase CheB [Nitrospinae bacterium]|nr:chemotaxis-specific protein-glutamate methyltransferase CheB [Nitrospinota bacterium]
MINVLIVDDSAVVRQHLKDVLESDSNIRVMGTVKNGEEAVRFVQKKKPDVITMDINMPNMNGFEATRRIMEINPVPIVIVTASYDRQDVEKSFHSMEAGALAIIEKPFGEGHPHSKETQNDLVQTVKLMAEVKVVRRWKREKEREERQLEDIDKTVSDKGIKRRDKKVKIVAIGASTGGPPIIQTILSGLKKGYPAPILVVQHISKGFLEGLTEWLNQSTGLPVHIAKHGEELLPGHIYFARDDYHLGVDEDGRLRLSREEIENGIRPSVSYMFRSIMNSFDGEAVGILLTGMGKDGAMELKMMKDNGAVTIAQDRESSVVYGMPGEAVRLDGATYILSPEEIAPMLGALAKVG